MSETGITVSENGAKTYFYNDDKINRIIDSGLAQGMSIPKIAQSLMAGIDGLDKVSAVRMARTSVTSAQNAARYNQRIADNEALGQYGLISKHQWIATHDERTRDSHAHLDGEIRDVGEKFSNGCRYPGDPEGEPAEVYNCRCTTETTLEGLTDDIYTSSKDYQDYHSWWNDKWLSSVPLDYGDNDPNLSGAARTVLEDFENNHWNDDIEVSLFVDDNGKIVEENKGDKHSVNASMYARTTASAMTHNHPRGDLKFGGTFSPGDMKLFVKSNQTTYRATAKEGTYSITKLKNFDGAGFLAYFTSERAKNRKVYEESLQKISASKWKSSQAQELAIAKAFNKYLKANHDILIAGQGKYGYYYTLERRPE